MMRTSVGSVRSAVAHGTVCAALLGVALAAPATATTLISDFNNLAISGAYNDFQTGTLTSTPTGFHIVAGDFGGMYKIVTPPGPSINATGETAVQLKIDVNPATDPLANKFNVVLFDNDPTPTQLRFEFTNVPIGAGQTLTIPISSGVVAAAGTTPGLDLSQITQWHFQGTFSNGSPGKTLDVTLHNLSLIGAVPEPSTLVLAGMALVAGLFGLRRRSA
jgi:hypothetical protein